MNRITKIVKSWQLLRHSQSVAGAQESSETKEARDAGNEGAQAWPGDGAASSFLLGGRWNLDSEYEKTPMNSGRRKVHGLVRSASRSRRLFRHRRF